MTSYVRQTPAATPTAAMEHFSARLQFETDCSDVAASQQAGEVDFVLLDVRSAAAYALGHVPGATSLPHREMTAERMAAYPADTLFVVYCAGPHCNGAQQAAFKLARLGYAVKEMIGGLTGWLDEGLALADDAQPKLPGGDPALGISCAC